MTNLLGILKKVGEDKFVIQVIRRFEDENDRALDEWEYEGGSCHLKEVSLEKCGSLCWELQSSTPVCEEISLDRGQVILGESGGEDSLLILDRLIGRVVLVSHE